MERFRAVGHRLLTRRNAELSSFAGNAGIQAESSSYFKRLVQRMSENQKNNDEMASRRVNGREKRVLPAGVATVVASAALFVGPLPNNVSIQRAYAEPSGESSSRNSRLSPAELYAGGPAVDVQVDTQTGRTRVSVQYGQVGREGEREERVRVAKKDAAVAKPEPISKVDPNLPPADQRVRFDKKNAAVAKPEPASNAEPNSSKEEHNCEDEFCPIDSKGHMLGRDAAHAFKRAQVEAGVEIVVASALRTREHQQRLFDCWQAREPGCNPANEPGNSYHQPENGAVAVDVENHEDERVRNALLNNGFCHPFRNDPREKHHFSFGVCA